jgi:hypothetical protein
MALSGVHIVCGYVGGFGAGNFIQSLIGKIAWSQTMASAGTTSQAAPDVASAYGAPAFEIRSSVDCYVAIGAVPDASQTTSSTTSNARIFVPSGETRNIFCSKGDKLAWVAA